MFTHILLPWILPLFGMFFAAGADALSGGEVTSEAPPDTGSEIDLSDVPEGDLGDEGVQPEQKVEPQQPTEEPEVQEFKGAVSARLRGMTKQAPELTSVFQTYSQIPEQ